MKRRNILITGASSGIGRGMALEFARRGRSLALCARRMDRLEALRDELLARHPDIRVAIRALDVNDHPHVFETFHAFARDLGSIDRVIVNAGLGKGQRLGTGHFEANRQTAETNFVSALAQCEAALELFRARGAGHLVTVCSVSAVRGFRGSLTTYAASKAGLAALSEGIRADLLQTQIRITTLFPGYIRSEMNERSQQRAPFIIDTDVGSRALVKAIEREPVRAFVPWWPWLPIAFLLRRLPLSMIARYY
jgi:short-subunit dehydrogenase